MFPKIVVPKMDGENNGKPYLLMDDLGVPLLLETPLRRNKKHYQKRQQLDHN